MMCGVLIEVVGEILHRIKIFYILFLHASEIICLNRFSIVVLSSTSCLGYPF